MHKQNHYSPHILVACTENASLHSVVPCHHWQFNASCLCSNTSAADCPQCTFSEADVFQKAAAVVVIVHLGHIQDSRLWVMEEGVYACDELNIRANAPSPFLPQSSVQNRVGWGVGGGHTFGSYTVQENSLHSPGWWVNIHMQSMYPYDALYWGIANRSIAI